MGKFKKKTNKKRKKKAQILKLNWRKAYQLQEKDPDMQGLNQSIHL
jgi:hypothetical protein